MSRSFLLARSGWYHTLQGLRKTLQETKGYPQPINVPAVLTLEEVVVEVHEAPTLLPLSDLVSKGPWVTRSSHVIPQDDHGSKLLVGVPSEPPKNEHHGWPAPSRSSRWVVKINILTQEIRHGNVKWAKGNIDLSSGFKMAIQNGPLKGWFAMNCLFEMWFS